MRRSHPWDFFLISLLMLTAPAATAQVASSVVGTDSGLRAEQVPADPSSEAARTRLLFIETNDPAALVYSDSTWMGRAASGPFRISRSARLIRLVSSSVDSWSRPPIEVLLDPAAGDTVRAAAFFAYRYRIESAPSARVYVSATRDLLGETPLELSLAAALREPLRLEHPGYRPETVDPDSALWNWTRVQLVPVRGAGGHTPDVSLAPPRRSSRWVDAVAAGAALVGGAVAVHYKMRADDRYARYAESGDPALRPGIKRLDTISGVGFGAMQAGIGVIAIRLVRR